ncbi:hypothetical protein KUV23_10335 [Algoriphagus marincola]|uniref:Uncharacterized protein n=1 Tax=Algoriphagus marincola TaxID=264027 RepID=A0ABS7N4Y7_9BACT|nr:hypothetical protein [Algoriphagus marincola]MBY5951373.1 hypothetical protein [Algoriphagus marincola]
MPIKDKENSGLNDVQKSLLRMFNREMTLEESEEIRDLLTKHYSEKLKSEVGRLIKEKKIDKADFDALREK